MLDGTYSADTGCVGPACVDTTNLDSAASLGQMLSTTAGDSYTLSFLFQGDGAPEDLVVLWGGQVIDDLCPTANNCANITDGSGFQTYTATGLVASSATTQLMFLGRQDPGFDRLDDVAVTDAGSAAAAPEPATLSLGLLGLVAYVAFRKYQNS